MSELIPRYHLSRFVAVFCCIACCGAAMADGPQATRLKYNHPGLQVDLGVGLWAWPLPMDYDQDGDYDLVVVCPDVPYNGTYFFENPTGDAFPVFKPAVRIADAIRNPQISYVEGQPRVLSPNQEYRDFRDKQLTGRKSLGLRENIHPARVRANQWKYCDYDADGRLDLLVGVGDWTEYGWDNAFNANGQWTNGPLHGFVYLLRGEADDRYAPPVKLLAGGKPVDVYGMPSPCLEDFDGDGDQDLLCGEFLDGFTYFQNIGTRSQPEFAAGRRLSHGEQPLRMDLQMITPTALDWDRDGDLDLIVGDEDGRVAWVEHTGNVVDGLPQFLPPRYFQQEADEVKFGALVTPVSFDWDADGDEDLICGNTAGYIGLIENLDGANPPRWAAPRRLKADGQVIRVQAGPQGSIQGPCEAKWGYTTLSVADWDHDGLPDIVANSIWGKVVWFRNVGRPDRPQLTAAQPVQVAWEDAPAKPAWNWWDPEPQELATQWRTTPVVVDWNEDGLNDLVMLDHEGYLAWFPRQRDDGDRLILLPPQRIFFGRGQHVYDSKHAPQGEGDGPLRLNASAAGGSGRRKLCVVDWDQDGDRDLLVNSRNVHLLEQVSTEGPRVWFKDQGELTSARLAGHTTSPTVVNWSRNGRPQLLIGAEDGFLYLVR